MDKIAEAKKEMRLKEWTQMYAEYQESGNTVTAWCKKQGLSKKPSITDFERYMKARQDVMSRETKAYMDFVCVNDVGTLITPDSVIQPKRLKWTISQAGSQICLIMNKTINRCFQVESTCFILIFANSIRVIFLIRT